MEDVEVLRSSIESLRKAIPELKGVLLASNEGLPLAYSLSNGDDPTRLAAWAAATASLGRQMSDSISAGNLNDACVRADQGAIFVYLAGPDAVLAVVSPLGSNLGLIHNEAREAAKQIESLLLPQLAV